MTVPAPAHGQATQTGAVGISCQGLVYIYRLEGYDVVALAGVDLDISPGESVALLGPSGSGKSTLLAVLAGLLPPSAGRLIVGDCDVTRASAGELAQLRAGSVGVVLQGTSRNLLPYLSAEQNVRFAQRGAAGHRNARQSAAREVLSLVGLSGRGRAKMRPHQLTPGERQRLALAVALSNGPGLLLADEPTSQLDSQARDEVISALESVRQAGTTVVLVTHDPTVGLRMGRTITIRDGRVGAEGRRGEDYAVVGRDGSIHLPPDVLQVFAPGTLIEVLLAPDGTARLVAARNPAVAGQRRAVAHPVPHVAPVPQVAPVSHVAPVSELPPVLDPPPVSELPPVPQVPAQPAARPTTTSSPVATPAPPVAWQPVSVGYVAPQPAPLTGFFATGQKYVAAQYPEPAQPPEPARYPEPAQPPQPAQYNEQQYSPHPEPDHPDHAESELAGLNGQPPPGSRSGLADLLHRDHGSADEFDYWGDK